METSIVPLTPALWPAFEELFGKQGACFGCWCTYFRLAPAERRSVTQGGKKALIRTRIEAGPPPGLLALRDGAAIGWMQIGPRADVPEWNGARRASAAPDPGDVNDPRAWAVSCFFVRKEARGTGVSHSLVAGGVEYARRNGARIVDACPIRLSQDTSRMGLFVGSARVFERAGFSVVTERRKGRPLMRLELDG